LSLYRLERRRQIPALMEKEWLATLPPETERLFFAVI
jgi:hypothetical protein